MVINGASRSNVRFWARHLQETKENDRAQVVKIDGLAAENLLDALREMEAHAKGTSCKNFMWHADINPRGDERLTEEEWEQARATLERHRGLTGQPYVVIEHEKEGRVHRHVVWSRIDTENARTLPDGLDAKVCHAAAREIERDLGLARTKSPLDKDRDGPRPKRAPEPWEMYRGMKSGIDPRDIQTEVTALFHQSDNGKALHAALEQRGYVLARGDRRGFVILDSAGHDHSLARRLDGINTKELNAFMRDVDRAALPSVEQGKAKQQERAMAERQADLATVQHEIAWEEALAKSAIEREKAERRFIEPSDRKIPGSREGGWPIMPPQPEPTTTSPRYHLDDAARVTTRPEPTPVMPEKLRGPAAHIWKAYHNSRDAQAFAAALNQGGIALGQATKTEAERSFREAAFAKEVGRFLPTYREGEIVAVAAESAGIYKLNERTTGADRPSVERFLARLDRASLHGLEATQQIQRGCEPNWEVPVRGGRIAQHIETASVQSDNAKAFAAALDARGIAFAVVSKAESGRSHREAAVAKEIGNTSARLREGEIVAVTASQLVHRRDGQIIEPRHIHQLDQATAESFLVALKIDRRELQGIDATKARLDARAEERVASWQAIRFENATRTGRAGRTLVGKAKATLKTPVRAAGGFFKAAGKLVDSLFELIDPVLTPGQKREQALHARDREADARDKIDFRRYLAERELDRQQQQGREAERQQRQRERDNRDR